MCWEKPEEDEETGWWLADPHELKVGIKVWMIDFEKSTKDIVLKRITK